ncbi:Lactose transport system permease protein LacF [Streptomyces lavendulae subsp. lavendulae]|uniref:Lactose transport system permease protein LacF n=2 Tax=Streptomyces TaxID=1883 RepID=A0A2K8PUX2_STRLA|nr:Lactose transport system permease protein LacF [Streptomyces lavendulae subsp. lavendulae]ATZ29465.1 Lactose transport system permease protein LacF [Streptomyces lavendulae subsp. lavendulae]
MTQASPSVRATGRRPAAAAPSRPARGALSGRPRPLSPLLFCAPFVALFVAMYIAPILYAAYNSLFTVRRSGLGLTAPTEVFAPLDNYVRAVHDGSFTASLGRVALFGVVQVPLMLAVALVLALLIDSKSARGRGFFRLTSFIPYAIPGVSAALVWSFMYSSTSSPLNRLLEPFSVTIPFFDDDIVLWSVANIVTWSWAGYNMIIIYAALQSIPAEVLEAARMDGASALRIAWSIKIPAVRGALVLTTVFSIIGSAQLFNEPTVLQPVSGGSISSAFTPLMSAQSAVAAGNYPYAAAQSVLLAVAVGLVSLIFFKLTRRGDQA